MVNICIHWVIKRFDDWVNTTYCHQKKQQKNKDFGHKIKTKKHGE